MPIINRLSDYLPDIVEWRRDIHRNPELLYEVHRTAGSVADKLIQFGVDEVATGVGRTGVVGVIRGRSGGRVIGLRADMDALPIEEETGLPYASSTPGHMHACGHDGHTAMLLGAARYLAETRNFSGTAIVIFQPAEEGGAGGKAMLDDGLMERFAIEEVYGIHNLPGLAIGEFAIRSGALMASTDDFEIEIKGDGGHAAQPHKVIDPILAGASLVQALQTIVSRAVDPLEAAVVSVTQFHAGTTTNVIPPTARIAGTVRALRSEIRDLLERRLRAISNGIAEAQGAEILIDFQRKYPVTVNHDDQTSFAISAAANVAGDSKVDRDTPPVMGAEDFSFMLAARPGAFIFLGNGDSAGLHSPEYDFNDEAIPFGVSYWIRLVEERLSA